MNSTVSITDIKTKRDSSQQMLGFLPHLVRTANRRPATSNGPSELPLLCDPEPYMDMLAAIDTLIKVLRPAMHIPMVGNAVASVVHHCKTLRESVAYYEGSRKAA